MSSGFPQSPAEQRIFDDAYRQWHTYGLLLCAVMPAIPIWPLWDWIVESLGYEGAAGIVSAGQIALALTVPERLAMRAAKRALTKSQDGSAAVSSDKK